MKVKAPDRLYTWFWHELGIHKGRKGKVCRLLACGKLNNAAIEFLEDGFKVVTNRRGLRKLKEK